LRNGDSEIFALLTATGLTHLTDYQSNQCIDLDSNMDQLQEVLMLKKPMMTAYRITASIC
jgi:hypothetical protein